MRIEPATLEDLALLQWDVSEDERGSFARTFCREELRAAGPDFEIVQANLSTNAARHTLRGLHFQSPPHEEPKIVSCLAGRIWDVAVDLREGSRTFRRWEAFELAPAERCALFIPAGFAHGFLTLEPDSVVHYLMGAPFVAGAGRGIRWDDPALGIDWPAAPAVISERDRSFPPLGPSGT
ncbi:MAG TPA: dTDP-4-dehydrorhamnose 3,5-epimerase [Allosphingosinicella sp.]|jgi:dTDP-4-dehydrorhamnose 3,5-epimerase